MFAKLRNSWALVKASASVLRSDKELIVFPIVSTIALALVTITFVVPMIAADVFDNLFTGESQILGYVVAFVYYTVNYTVIIFANSALVGAAMIRLKGGDPTLGDGFRIATERFGTILGYALISATVGLILKFISERGKRVGQIVADLGGLAWSLATYLAVPVLVVENVGPLEAVKRSANLLKKTWGEQIVGNFGIGAVQGLAILLVFLLSVPLFILAGSAESLLIAALTGAALVIAIVLISLIGSTLNGIYVAAVYRSAAEDEVGSFFDEQMVREAFKAK
jgi:hypothetical protein